MIFQEQNNGLQGLNGFWRNLWNGFRSAFTSNNSDDEQTTFSGKIGRVFGRIVSAATGSTGIWRIGEYVPTPQEFIILNPLQSALNTYMIQMVRNVDLYFDNYQDTAARMDFLNNAIRKIQVIQSFFANHKLPSLSGDAQDFLADGMETMLTTFELTIEELLTENGIEYTKTEGVLAVSSGDTYPASLAIKTQDQGYGIQYRVPNANNEIISTDIPSTTGTTVNITPNQNIVKTDKVAGADNSGSGGLMAFGLFVFAVLVAAFTPNEKEKKAIKN